MSDHDASYQPSNEDRLRWLIRERGGKEFEGVANMLAICFAPWADEIIAEYDGSHPDRVGAFTP